jgi:hypothetical protein
MNKPNLHTRVKAILLDSENQNIKQIEFAGITELYEIIGCSAIQGSKSYWAGQHNDEVMYFDEEALIKDVDKTRFAVGHAMLPPEQITPIIGKVIICRVLPDGTHADTSLEPSTLSRLIRFYSVQSKQNQNPIKLN